MSQNDLSIANQGFASFRSDLNSALQALGSTNSGTSAPSTTYANQLFYDTTNNILKIRNEDNDAFISLFTLDQTNDNIEALTIDGTLTYNGDLVSSTAGTSNFRAGVNAGNSITSGGNYNVTIGDEAGTALTTGDNNVAIGFEALKAEDGHGDNVAIGYQALKALNAGGDSHNVAVGNEAGKAFTTGQLNSVIGSLSGTALTEAGRNTAVGYATLTTDTLGSRSTAIGYGALSTQNFASATNSNNTAIGHVAGSTVTTGTKNTLIGSEVGDGLTTGSRNTALGYRSLSGAVDDGQYNTCVGADAGLVLTGDQNTFVGSYDPSTGGSGAEITSGSKNTILGAFNGNQDGLDIRTSSNRVVISDGDGDIRIYSEADGTTYFNCVNQSTDDSFYIESNGVLNILRASGSSRSLIGFKNGGSTVGTITCTTSNTAYNTSSDYRLKENVVDMTGAIDRVKQLSPKRFNFIIDADKTVDGFIAHEAQAIIPEAITGEKDAVDDNGDAIMQGIDQSKIVPLLTGALKEAIAKIEALETRVATLEG